MTSQSNERTAVHGERVYRYPYHKMKECCQMRMKKQYMEVDTFRQTYQKVDTIVGLVSLRALKCRLLTEELSGNVQAIGIVRPGRHQMVTT